MSEPLHDLIDAYLSGLLDEAGLRQLEELLRADAAARRYFVRYARLHTDLHLEVRARRAGARALDRIEGRGEPEQNPAHATPHAPRATRRRLAAAACVLVAAGVGLWFVANLSGRGGTPEAAVAWLVNAQNCLWADGVAPEGNLAAGTVLKIERGLAEIRFRCGAVVVLEGSARLELLSGNSAQLLRGKLAARVPPSAAGFEVLSPRGRVIDLGTEFGVVVAEDGATDVYVFEGQVKAHPRAAGPPQGRPVLVAPNHAARIDAHQVTVRPAEPGAGSFVRAIVPPPVVVPRTLPLTFDRPVEGTVGDADGLGTGLTHRLPGTGTELPPRDTNLRLNVQKRQLELTTTKSDLNTRHLLHQGEYLGLRLADLGFTGKEDFAATVTILDIPALEFVGQFGLYAGARNDRTIRGGLLSRERAEPGQYTQFLVNNHAGRDTSLHTVGLLRTGTNLRLTLKRKGGNYSLTVENLTEGGTSTLTPIRHPAFLDRERDLYVGLFGANTQSEVRRTLVIKDFQVTVWTVRFAVSGEW